MPWWEGPRSPGRTTTPRIAMPSWRTCRGPTRRWISTRGIGTPPIRMTRDFVRIATDLRSRLDRHGLHATQSILSEWNYGLSDRPPPPLVRASFVASALIYMQGAPIDAATLYRADNVFGADGATPDKTGQALIALGRMKATPVLLKATGADLGGFAVEAGRSSDGRVVQVLISNYQIP